MKDWRSRYAGIRTTADAALACVADGDRVYLHPGCATPLILLEALCRRAAHLNDVEVVHLMTFGAASHVLPEMRGHLRHNAVFIGSNVRAAVNDGRADYTPIFLSEVATLFRSGKLPVKVALVQVSQPDVHGFCSLGVGVDHTLDAVRSAQHVVAEVNARMPRVHGDSFLHVGRLDAVVETDRPLAELPHADPDPVAAAIARHVASLIEDGATLQTGIGAIPDAVLGYLSDRRHLGVHSELFSDGIIDLVESGALTGARKTLHPGKIVAGFVLGSQRLFDFVHDNPMIELHPLTYVNDPFVIAQNARMVAINSALAVDLTGQVCADSIGHTFYSGFGGQTDFVRGAARAPGGRPIIALPSTARDGTISRIVSELAPGAGVVTTRADVHWVATEFGAVDLHGANVRQRAQALIGIAHPDFRGDLERSAHAHHLL